MSENYSRVKPSGCWDDCPAKSRCWGEANGLCRSIAYRYEMPAPNQLTERIGDLKFGSTSYDEHPAKVKWERDMYGSKRKPYYNWRDSLEKSDKWADLNICFDPAYIIEQYGKVESGWWDIEPARVLLPDLLTECLLESPAVISSVREMAGRLGASSENSGWADLQRKVSNVFEGAYKAKAAELRPDLDARFSKCKIVFMSSAPIIAKWCLQHYYMNPEYWVSLLSRYSDMTNNVPKPGQSKLKFNFKRTDEVKDGRQESGQGQPTNQTSQPGRIAFKFS